MKKGGGGGVGGLQLGIQLHFWVTLDTCNSKYLHDINVIGQVALIALDEIHYMKK
jgi:hypothetical protein